MAEVIINPAGERLPVSVLTGFLGSGKTTLLGKLLKHPDMARTAVVINEFGEIPLDHLLVESSSEDMITLNSGCLCCTVRGDLTDTLRNLYLKRAKQEINEFDRVVIETTGLADPAPILHTLMNDPVLAARYRLDGVIATVDAVNAETQLDNHFESVKQAAVADRVVITKSDLADPAQLDRVRGRLQKLNPAAPLFPISFGEIEPARLFDAGLYDAKTKSVDVERWLKEEAYAEAHGHGHAHHDHGHAHGHDHQHDSRHGLDVNRHDDKIRAFCVTHDEPLAWETVSLWLELMTAYRGPDLLRIKGILNVSEAEGPVVVHGVQHVFHPPVVLEQWPSEDRRSRLVFITRDLDRGVVEEMLATLLKGGEPQASAASGPSSA